MGNEVEADVGAEESTGFRSSICAGVSRPANTDWIPEGVSRPDTGTFLPNQP